MNKTEREQYFLLLEDLLLIGGVSFSEWCSFISKSVYISFIHGADLATIITATACIESYFRTENSHWRNKNLDFLINNSDMIGPEAKEQLHMLRKYRNRWVHIDLDDDELLLNDEGKYIAELENMSKLAVKLMLTVLYSNQFI